jgi:hypothetical protein
LGVGTRRVGYPARATRSLGEWEMGPCFRGLALEKWFLAVIKPVMNF